MIETTALETAACPTCARQVLVACDLDANDELIDVCAHCNTPISADTKRSAAGGYTLRALGYTIEGEGPDSEGCGIGGGGCGSGGGCSSH